MLSIKSIIYISVLIFTSKLSFGQNVKDDLKKINSAYIQNKKFSMNITYNLYQSHKSTSIFKAEFGKVLKDNGKLYNKLAHVETIQNENYAIVVDKESKVILVGLPKSNETKEIFPLQFDKLEKLCKSVEFVKISNNSHCYRFKTDYSKFERVDLYYNPETYFIEKLILFFKYPTKIDENNKLSNKEKPRLEILCQNINLSPVISQDIFLEKKYIKIQSGQLVSQRGYEGYKLINTIQKPKNIK